MKKPGNLELSKALKVLDHAKALHSFDPNVSLVDIGYKIQDRQGRKREEAIAVRVHVKKKIPRGESFEEFKRCFPERVPTEKQIGFRTDVPEGPYGLHQHLRYPYNYHPWYTNPVVNPRAASFNPLQGGISISNENHFGYGTLGGKVVDRESGETMIMSNWHVLVGSWTAFPGQAILQPANRDGGTSAKTIATYTRDAFDDNIDAAVATLNQSRDCINEQLDIGEVAGVQIPELGMSVVKSGRGSKITTGIVTGIEGEATFRYSGLMRTVSNVIHISPENPDDEVSRAGDSGAWWLNAENNKAVGLHFAGSNYPEYALAMSMPPVLDALNVKIPQ